MGSRLTMILTTCMCAFALVSCGPRDFGSHLPDFLPVEVPWFSVEEVTIDGGNIEILASTLEPSTEETQVIAYGIWASPVEIGPAEESEVRPNGQFTVTYDFTSAGGGPPVRGGAHILQIESAEGNQYVLVDPRKREWRTSDRDWQAADR